MRSHQVRNTISQDYVVTNISNSEVSVKEPGSKSGNGEWGERVSTLHLQEQKQEMRRGILRLVQVRMWVHRSCFRRGSWRH